MKRKYCKRTPSLNELHCSLHLCSEIIFGDKYQSKMITTENYLKKTNKKTSVGTMIFWIKINLSSIRLGVLNCFCRAANTTNVAFNHQRPFISQHKEPKLKCCWSSRERVSVCISAHTMVRECVFVLLRECLIFHQHARALLVVHATSGTHHA